MTVSLRPELNGIQADPLTQATDAIIQFRNLLTNRNYDEAAKTSETLLKLQTFLSLDYRISHLIAILIAHVKNTPNTTTHELTRIVEVIVAYDKNGNGLNVGWMEADPFIFKAALQSYITTLKNQKFTSEQLEQELKGQLTGLVSYNSFPVTLAQVFINELQNFDPRIPHHPGAQTCLESAQLIGRNQEVIMYLETLSPDLSSIPEAIVWENDTNEFSGIAELQGEFHETGIAPKQGEILLLATTRKIYEFIGKNSVAEGDTAFFKYELQCKQKYCSLKEAKEYIQKFYQKNIEEYETVKSLLKQGDFEISCTNELSLDSTISDGHKNVGVIQLNNEPAVCKFMATISVDFKESCFGIIQRVSAFVLRCRELRKNVPNVVEILPHIILNRTRSGDIQVGYLMKKESGEQLRKISWLSIEEKLNIQAQFESSVESMLESGYALYDFNDDNVLWDQKKLTFIDVSEAGFKEEALQHADTPSVIWRMSKMLESK